MKVIAKKFFVEAFWEEKGKVLEILNSHFVRLKERLKGEYSCTRCITSKAAHGIPGEFRDFNADSEWSGRGVPLCYVCLGTGKYLKTEEFKRLQREVFSIREASFTLQCSYWNNEDECWNELEAYNGRLCYIAKRGLELVRYPAENCLAAKLAIGR